MPTIYQKILDLKNMPKVGWMKSDLRDLDSIWWAISQEKTGEPAQATDDATLRDCLGVLVKFVNGKWDRCFGGKDGEEIHRYR